MDFLLLAAGAAPPNRSMMEDVTTVHLILIAIVAVIVIVGLVVGTRMKARREAGHAEFERQERAELERQQAGVSPTPPSPPPLDEPATPLAAAAPTSISDAAEPGQPAYVAPSPEPVAPTQAPPPAPADGGQLTQLKGLGPKVAAALGDAGITSLAQLAALSDSDAAALDARLGTFQGRMARDRWIEQARLLTSGDRAGYEAQFGKLG